MDMKTASETVNQTTSQYFSTSLKKATGYFFLGGAYALVTAGPILLTAGVCAVYTLFDRIVSSMLRDLVHKDIISLRTFSILHNTVNILSCTALIITGIYLNILGPVAIMFVALNIIHSLGDFNEALKMPQPPIQNNAQPAQQRYTPPSTYSAPVYIPNQPPPPYEYPGSSAPRIIPPASAPPFEKII